MKVSPDIDKVQPGVEELLALTDFLVPGTSFLYAFSSQKDCRKGPRALSDVTSGFVAVTRGKEGVAALWGDQISEISGIAVNSLDTTGAGDVFHGAFLYGLFQVWSVGRCLRFANAAGAFFCTRYGARGGIPPLHKVVSMVNSSRMPRSAMRPFWPTMQPVWQWANWERRPAATPDEILRQPQLIRGLQGPPRAAP